MKMTAPSVACRLALAVLVACFATSSGAAFGRREAGAPEPPPAEPAPADAALAPADAVGALMQELGFQLPRRAVQAVGFDLQDLAGISHSLDAYRGSVVFLNFWATWCAPCRTEMPAMQALHERLHVQRLVSVGRPRNNFRLAENARRTLLLAGGIGITPLMAMLSPR